MLRIALCDDDALATSYLAELLLHYSFMRNKEFEIRHFNKANMLIHSDYIYDILFLDIMLDDNIDGTELACLLRKQGNRALFIITTSRKDKYADAIEATVFRYLLKPFHQIDINKVMDAIFEYFLLNDTLTITYKGNTEYIIVNKIVFIESIFKKIHIHTTDRKVFHTTNESLAEIADKLKKYRCFFRIHKSYIINFDHITASSKTKVQVSINKDLPIARGHFEEFQTKFNDYIGCKL